MDLPETKTPTQCHIGDKSPIDSDVICFETGLFLKCFGPTVCTVIFFKSFIGLYIFDISGNIGNPFIVFAPIIKTIPNDQNVFNLRQQKSKSLVSFSIILISVMSICGFPLFLGFLSLKFIFAGAISYHQNFGELTFIIPLFVFISTFITNFYMVRLIIIIFLAAGKILPVYFFKLLFRPCLYDD